MMDLLNKRPLWPLVVASLALAGCDGKDGDDDDDTDTDTVVDTVDTFDAGDDFIVPESLGFDAEFAVNADGELSDYSVDGQGGVPAFYATLSDGRSDCVLGYFLKPEAWGHVGMLDAGGDTDTDAADTDTDTPADTDAPPSAPEDLLTWLDENNLVFGFKVAEGLYEPGASPECEDLDPEIVDGDPHLWVLSGETESVYYVGFKEVYGSELDDIVTQIADANMIGEEKFYGGRIKFPFEFGTEGGGTSDFFELTGFAGEVDASMEVQADGQGNLILIDAAEIWDGEQPAQAFYRAIFPLGFTFSF